MYYQRSSYLSFSFLFFNSTGYKRFLKYKLTFFYFFFIFCFLFFYYSILQFFIFPVFLIFHCNVSTFLYSSHFICSYFCIRVLYILCIYVQFFKILDFQIFICLYIHISINFVVTLFILFSFFYLPFSIIDMFHYLFPNIT